MSRKKLLSVQYSPWIASIGLFVIWEVVVRGLHVPAYILPTQSASLEAAWTFRDAIWMHAAQTLMTTLAGFAIAVAFGVVLGSLVGSSGAIYSAANPILIGFNSVPKVALVPILVMWFGIGSVPAILTAFLISFFPIVVNVATGLATLEPELRDVLRSLGASRLDILIKVGFPRSLSETVASNVGMGYLMMSASSKFNMPLVFAGLLVIAAMGVAMYGIFSAIERRSTRWAMRGAPTA